MAAARRAAIAKGDLPARQSHVLDAAQTCFIRGGIQRATMQDIAREALMSPANIYRYFPSKEAVVEAWIQRECERSDALVAGLGPSDGRSAIMTIAERMIADLTREEAILRLDMWLEISRNPGLTPLLTNLENLFRDWFTRLLTPPHRAVRLAEAASAMMKGMLVNRALLPGYDPGPALTQLRALLDAPADGSP